MLKCCSSQKKAVRMGYNHKAPGSTVGFGTFLALFLLARTYSSVSGVLHISLCKGDAVQDLNLSVPSLHVNSKSVLCLWVTTLC